MARRDLRQRDRRTTWARCGLSPSGTLWRCRARDRAIRSPPAPALLAGGPRVAAQGSGSLEAMRLEAVPLEAVALEALPQEAIPPGALPLEAMPPEALLLEAPPLKEAPQQSLQPARESAVRPPGQSAPARRVARTQPAEASPLAWCLPACPVPPSEGRDRPAAYPTTALRPMMDAAPARRGGPGAARSQRTVWTCRWPRTDRASRRQGEPGQRREPAAVGPEASPPATPR